MGITVQEKDIRNRTMFIKPDEKCMGVLDVDLMAPDFKGTHRYRLTYVVRDGKVAAYSEDLTEDGRYSKLGTHPMVQVIVNLEHTVAESWDIADAAYSTGARERIKAKQDEASTDRSMVKEYWERQAMANEYIRRNRRTAERIDEDVTRSKQESAGR